jgi:hypothetical protein
MPEYTKEAIITAVKITNTISLMYQAKKKANATKKNLIMVPRDIEI